MFPMQVYEGSERQGKGGMIWQEFMGEYKYVHNLYIADQPQSGLHHTSLHSCFTTMLLIVTPI